MLAIARQARRRSALSTLAWTRADAHVLCAQIPKPWGGSSQLLRFEDLVPPGVLHSARDLVPSLALDRDPDSVDGQPTFELVWMQNGEYTHAGLERVFRETVEARIVPAIRRSTLMPRGSDLVLCQALLRSYEGGRRCVHPAHYDSHALVTAVMELPLAPESTSADSCSRSRESNCSIGMKW